MGRHARRKTDPYQPPPQGQAGTPKQVAGFDSNVSRHVVNAADKRLHGQHPYDLEPGSKPTVDPETAKRRSK